MYAVTVLYRYRVITELIPLRQCTSLCLETLSNREE